MLVETCCRSWCGFMASLGTTTWRREIREKERFSSSNPCGPSSDLRFGVPHLLILALKEWGEDIGGTRY